MELAINSRPERAQVNAESSRVVCFSSVATRVTIGARRLATAFSIAENSAAMETLIAKNSKSVMAMRLALMDARVQVRDSMAVMTNVISFWVRLATVLSEMLTIPVVVDVRAVMAPARRDSMPDNSALRVPSRVVIKEVE